MSGRAPDAPRPLMARVLGAVATGTLVAFWVGFAPTSVGGDFSYAIVRGDSMRPRLDNGDIVILRRERQYGVGDVVGYHDPQIGPVLHRIVSKQGERFVIRGDNRKDIDPYAPLTLDVIGREVAFIPNGLPIVLAFTSLRTLIPIAVAFVVLSLAWESLTSKPRFRRRRPLRLRRHEIEVT